MQQKEVLNEVQDDSSTTLQIDPRKPPNFHNLKCSTDLPMISTYNETEIKLLVKVTDSDVRPVLVNIETDTVRELKRKVGSR